jgi:hypothetical protein
LAPWWNKGNLTNLGLEVAFGFLYEIMSLVRCFLWPLSAKLISRECIWALSKYNWIGRFPLVEFWKSQEHQSSNVLRMSCSCLIGSLNWKFNFFSAGRDSKGVRHNLFDGSIQK